MARCLIVTGVWGTFHTKAFIDLNLPTLLAPGNLPAFTARTDSRYLIFTTAADLAQMESSPLFQRLKDTLPVTFVDIALGTKELDIDVHQYIWSQGLQQAKAENSFIMFMPPDVVWSDGSLEHLAKRLQAGRKALFLNWHLRAVNETFSEDFANAYLQNGVGTVSANARDLVKMCLEHIHPISTAYLRDSPNFPLHPEMVFWSVPEQGLLMRVLALTPFIFDTTVFTLNSYKLIEQVDDSSLVECVTDSDDLFMVSLQELGRYTNWYDNAARLDYAEVARWWATYNSPANDILISAPFRLKFSEGDEFQWRRQELASRQFSQRLVYTREAVRLWQLAKFAGCNLAASIIAFAICTGLAARLKLEAKPATVFLPTDDALRPYWEKGLSGLLASDSRGRLIDFLAAHTRTDDAAGVQLVLEQIRAMPFTSPTPPIDSPEAIGIDIHMNPTDNYFTLYLTESWGSGGMRGIRSVHVIPTVLGELSNF